MLEESYGTEQNSYYEVLSFFSFNTLLQLTNVMSIYYANVTVIPFKKIVGKIVFLAHK